MLMVVRVAAITLLMAGAALAEDAPSTSDQEAGALGSFMSAYGFGEHETLDGKPPAVVLTLDQMKASEHLMELHALDILNESVTQETVNKKPTMFCTALLLQYTLLAIREVYGKYPNLDRVHFVAKAIQIDDYGNDQSHDMFSLDFTKAIAKKINWDKFPTGNLMKIAPNFHFSPWNQEHFQEEKANN